MGSSLSLRSLKLFKRIIIADDHILVAQGIRKLIEHVSQDIELVQSGEDLVRAVSKEPPDLVIADVAMPGISGVDAMKTLQASGYDAPFVFLTMHDEPSMAFHAIRAGGRGYLPKTAAGDELIRALEDVVGGRTYIASGLSARMLAETQRIRPIVSRIQLRILGYVAQGMRNKQIADEMELSVRTIESHKYAMMQELRVHSTLELLNAAKKEGLFDD